METFENELRLAMETKKLPGVVLAAANQTFNYLKAFGNLSLFQESTPLSTNATFCLASCTKLVTCVAAMQCVERGHVSLKSNVGKIVPQLRSALLLKGYNEDGKPVLEYPSGEITLETLLNHTSGITGGEDEEIMKYWAAIGDDKATLLMRYFGGGDEEVKRKALPETLKYMGSLELVPLLFEPGTAWAYGQSTDWAGRLVETLTNQTLEIYCQNNIFKPLGMTSTSYRLISYPHIKDALIPMAELTKTGTVQNCETIYPVDPEIDLGGSNLYSSVPDFMKLLVSLLKNDGKILKSETVDLMFNTYLSDPSVLTTPKAKDFFGGMTEEGIIYNHCLAGLVNTDKLKIGRRESSITWQGATKCFWWLDRVSGVCGSYGSQLIGYDKDLSGEMNRKFERAVYVKTGAAAEE